jgi:hypothetical protein
VGFVVELSAGFGLANSLLPPYRYAVQVLIKFPDAATELKALGKLIPRFPGKSWAAGETMVPSPALAFLAAEGITFTVIGPATYERLAPLRDSGAVAV